MVVVCSYGDIKTCPQAASWQPSQSAEDQLRMLKRGWGVQMRAHPIHIDRNGLLASLPIPVRRSLIERFEKVRLEAGEILHDAGEPAEYVWFITSGIVSLQMITEDDRITEVALVGSNGAIGAHAIVRKNVSYRAQVYTEGEALRIRTRDLRQAVRQDSTLRDAMVEFLVSLMEQMARRAGQIQHDELKGWLADRLLLMRTLLSSDSFETTHEYIAKFIGVPRTDVTEALGVLRDAGAIYHSRGYIEILNANKLKKAAGDFFDEEIHLPPSGT
jgi:CRP-like cAMP-binding protein